MSKIRARQRGARHVRRIARRGRPGSRTRVIILGAGGRDFHNFNVYFRGRPEYQVVAFTATQIPDLEGRLYPPVLAGPLYPAGIHIYAEDELAELVRRLRADQVVFAYSDVSHEHVMHVASIAMAAGASFVFLRSNLHIVIADPHRPGHEVTYHPGETNLRMADVVVINKVDTARPQDVASVRANVARANPEAVVIEAASPVQVDDPSLIPGRRALVVEDGPTVTHGGMAYGAGVIAARKYGVKDLVDPRPYAVGSIRQVFAAYPHLGSVLPAMGYGAQQTKELQETIAASDCDLVVIGTPVDLRRVITIRKPAVRVWYELQEITKPDLEDILKQWWAEQK